MSACLLLALLCGLGLLAVLFSALLMGRKGPGEAALRSVTRLIFVTTQVSALVWVFTSYAIAAYAVLRLGQVYTLAELSAPAIHTVLGVSFLKVLENIFEHNDGPVFGRSKEDME